jgi:hypothetical protein
VNFLIQNPHLTQSDPRKIDPYAPPFRPVTQTSEEATQTSSNNVHKQPPHHSACYMS